MAEDMPPLTALPQIYIRIWELATIHYIDSRVLTGQQSGRNEVTCCHVENSSRRETYTKQEQKRENSGLWSQSWHHRSRVGPRIRWLLVSISKGEVIDSLDSESLMICSWLFVLVNVHSGMIVPHSLFLTWFDELCRAFRHSNPCNAHEEILYRIDLQLRRGLNL